MNITTSQQFYSERTKAYLANKAKYTKRNNTLFTVVVCAVAVSPIIGTLIVLMNELS